MCVWWTLCVAVVALCAPPVWAAGHFTPTWAVHVPAGQVAADAVAAEHGFVNMGEIINKHYHFHHNRIVRRSASPAEEHHTKLTGDSRVRWAKQQRILSRAKRDFIIIKRDATQNKKDGASKRELLPAKLKGRPRSATDSKFQLNDPKWPHMWYLNRGGGLDMNVIPAWREGITGRGVVVTILDDGLETDHPDLTANYDPMASYDVNSYDSDPQPRYDMIDSNRHGTRCAGEVAATANNSLCAVGVAYDASVGGVRMLDGDVTDAVEARSLSLNPQHVDIYSASWGPDDDGKTVDGPGELATRAFIEGVTKGRNGKGSIFVWASGNGGRDHDNCNCDGYTNSIWTLSISAATERGEVPWYSEQCSSTLATTYSSGGINEKQVVTTDLHHTCTAGHTGTSASAPLAAGICALALQANTELTWRDMQHIVVRTARPERLSSGGEWRTNGVGRNVSHSFGYGLLDAAGMVRLARSWKTVPPQRRCELAAPRPQRPIPARGSVTLQLNVGSCPGVNYLEHVQARVSLSATRRGDLRVILTSPAGTKVTLLAPRGHDTSRAGFSQWPFMSVHSWGESPLGVWQLEVHNEGRYLGGAISQWSLVFFGTETPPQESVSADVGSNLHTEGGELNWSGTMGADMEIGVGNDREYSEEEVKQNALHDDLGMDLWRDSHMIREEDAGAAAAHASSGCRALAPEAPHHCLECTGTYHLYGGRCYEHCPDGTYASETLTQRSGRRRNFTHLELPTKENTSSSLKRDGNTQVGSQVNTTGLTIEAADMIAFEGSNITVPRSPRICLPCHYTCANCSGPGSHQCLSCPKNSVLVNTTLSETMDVRLFCYPNSQLPDITYTNWYYRINVALSIIIFALFLIGIMFCIKIILKANSGKTVNYNKLPSEELERSFEVETEISKAIEDSSSESEDDLNL